LRSVLRSLVHRKPRGADAITKGNAIMNLILDQTPSDILHRAGRQLERQITLNLTKAIAPNLWNQHITNRTRDPEADCR
jgi:hypothetical protein